MGVSIHYCGRLDDVGLLPALCEEVRDIADTMGWPCESLDEDWNRPADATFNAQRREIVGNLGLKGVQFTPHVESESLSLFFDAGGNLRCPLTMVLILEGAVAAETARVSMKTQFAGPETHVWVIGFLKYLQKRYVSDLQVSDEGDYWETGDRQELVRRMALIDGKLQQFSAAISTGEMGDLSNLSADEIAARIEQWLLRRK